MIYNIFLFSLFVIHLVQFFHMDNHQAIFHFFQNDIVYHEVVHPKYEITNDQLFHAISMNMLH